MTNPHHKTTGRPSEAAGESHRRNTMHKLIATLGLALAVILFGFTSPAAADAVDDAEAQLGTVTYEYAADPAQPYGGVTQYECTNRKKVSKNVKIMETPTGGDYYDDVWKTALYYKHCVSLTNYYEDIGLMHLSLQRTGAKDCRNYDFDKFYLNPSSIAGVNVAGFDQDCTRGQEWYMRSYEPGVRLWASEGDRCFDHVWKYRVVGGNDIEGNSPNACFA